MLAVTDHSGAGNSAYYATYDANGNVSEYIDDSGTVVVHYEYCPFGQLTVATGVKADDFVHRFSTKYLDSETGLYYYGFRYYSSELGRWINRDPVEELGHVRLKFPTHEIYYSASLLKNKLLVLFADLIAQTGEPLDFWYASIAELRRQQIEQLLVKLSGDSNIIYTPTGRIDIYSFVLNNPIIFIDDKGEFFIAIPAGWAGVWVVTKGVAAVTAVGNTAYGLYRGARGTKETTDHLYDAGARRADLVEDFDACPDEIDEFKELLTESLPELYEYVSEISMTPGTLLGGPASSVLPPLKDHETVSHLLNKALNTMNAQPDSSD